MIYRFRFEIWDDDHSAMISGRTEESGDFWKAFKWFILGVMTFICHEDTK